MCLIANDHISHYYRNEGIVNLAWNLEMSFTIYSSMPNQVAASDDGRYPKGITHLNIP